MIRASIGTLPVPLTWLNTLYKIQEVFPPAVLAGGCLRDLWNGIKPKDVDVFIPVQLVTETTEFDNGLDIIEQSYHIEQYEEKLQQLFPTAECIAQAFYGRGNAELERTILSVWHVTYNGLEYDIIFIADVVDITTFDINICQISCDGTDLFYTDDFVHGTVKRELKVMNINRTDRNMKRLERMKLKYPDWSIADGNLGN